MFMRRWLFADMYESDMKRLQKFEQRQCLDNAYIQGHSWKWRQRLSLSGVGEAFYCTSFPFGIFDIYSQNMPFSTRTSAKRKKSFRATKWKQKFYLTILENLLELSSMTRKTEWLRYYLRGTTSKFLSVASAEKKMFLHFLRNVLCQVTRFDLRVT